MRRFTLLGLITAGMLTALGTLLVWQQRRQDRLNDDLIAALKRSDTPAAIQLLDSGASANAVDRSAEPRGQGRSVLTVLEALLHRQQSPSGAPAITLVYPNTMPGDIMRPPESLPLLRVLIAHGADPNAANSRGFTVLHKAAMAKHAATILYLLDHGANPNSANDEGYAPLQWSNAEIAEQLLAHGADANHRDATDDVVLSTAVFVQDEARAEVLLRHGADANAQDNRGLTPLHFVVEFGDTRPPWDASYRGVTRLLLEHGARITIRDSHGISVLDYARKRRMRSLLPMLEQASKNEARARPRPSGTIHREISD